MNIDMNAIILAVIASLTSAGGAGIWGVWFGRRKTEAEAGAISVKAEVELTGAAMDLVELMRKQLDEANVTNAKLAQLVELERASRVAAEDREHKVRREFEDRERILRLELDELRRRIDAQQRELDELHRKTANNNPS